MFRGIISNEIEEIIYFINIYIISLFWGALAYTAIKRSTKISLLFLIPYMLLSVGSPIIYNNSFEDILKSLSYAVDYFGGIILPFAILGSLIIIKKLMKNIKSQFIIGFVATIVTVILHAINTIMFYWIAYIEVGILVPFQFPTQLLMHYAIGICMTSLLLHIAYKER